MFPSPPLPWFELARLKRHRLTRIAVLAVAAVPLFYGALYIWANLDPTGNLDDVQAAVVNNDEMIEIEGPDGEPEPVAIGRLLAGNLVGDDAENNYDWVLTSPQDAREGLEDGSYKAVLTIPENLSTAATSTDDPEEAVQGRLDLKTNDAVNFVNGQIAERILDAARQALNAQVTETYLDNLYLGFTDIKASLSEAADGAGELADGAGELEDGARQLDGGAQELAGGAAQLADGAARADEGAQELAGGLGQLDRRTRPLQGQADRLADGAEQVADGTAQVNQLVQQVTGVIVSNTDEARAALSRLEGTLNRVAEQCRSAESPGAESPGIDCGPVEQAAAGVADLRGQVDEIAAEAEAAGGQTQQLADGARQVADGNAQLAAGLPALIGAISEASAGADQLAAGTGQLRTGSSDLAAGAAELAGATGQLASGAGQLQDGAVELRDGLAAGSEEVPDYSEDDRETLAETAATPVTEATDRLNAVASYGEGLAPYFIALAMWVGAMAVYLLLRPLSDRAIASDTGALRTAAAGFVPGALLTALQAGLLIGVLLWIVGIGAERPWSLLGLTALTGVVFAAINQAFVAWFGGAGRFVAIVFVCLQLTAAGGTYPIETAPAFFGFLHDLLPMTYAVHGMRAAIAGSTQGVGGDVAALATFGVVALLATAAAAKQRQRVTMTRLHPTLQV